MSFLRATAFGFLAFGTLPLTAAAQSTAGDVFTVLADYTVSTDSNLFRRPDSANPRSDVINVVTGTLRFDKAYSLQRFHLEATETLSRYHNSSYLNYDATSYKGSWLWSPRPWLNVSIGADRSKSLALFEDTLGSQRNIRTRENWNFGLDGRIAGNWSWVAGIAQSDQKSEQGIVNLPDQRTDSAQFGIKYVTPFGDSIGLTRRSSKGNYQGSATSVTGRNFKQDDNELNGSWTLSEKSQLTGRLTHLERTNNQIGQRDYSGMSGDIGYNWKPTGDLSINIAANRNTSPLQDLYYSYSANDNLSITPSWKFSEKISAHMRLQRANYKYRGSGILPAPVGVPARKDITNSTEIGADWSPLRKLSLKFSLQRQRRTSNTAGIEYDDNIARFSVLWTF